MLRETQGRIGSANCESSFRLRRFVQRRRGARASRNSQVPLGLAVIRGGPFASTPYQQFLEAELHGPIREELGRRADRRCRERIACCRCGEADSRPVRGHARLERKRGFSDRFRLGGDVKGGGDLWVTNV